MQKDTYQVAWIILNAVKNMEVGVNKLALFLKGSKSKLVVPIENKQIFGGLMWCDIPTITGFIKQLLDMELIGRKDIYGSIYSYPVIELTDAGRKVLDEKIKIDLQIVKEEKPIKVSESEKLTFELFNQGESIEQIAQERNLAVSTVYDHLYRLVVNDYLSSSDVVSEKVINLVTEAYKEFPAEPSLKELKEKLPEEIYYNEIKCVLADLKKRNIK